MKIVRFQSPGSDSSAARYGIVEGSTVYAAEGDLFGGLTKGDQVGPLDDRTLLAPLTPGKVIAIARIYVDHLTESGPTRTSPSTPVVVMKPTSAIIGPEQPIELANPENNTD